MDMTTGFRRENAKVACESLKMTLISFEGDRQKWDAINSWLLENGKFIKYSHPILKQYFKN